MEFSTTLNNRISIRDFKDKQISKEILKTIVSDAQQAPSWANSQPWRVYIATGDTMKEIQKIAYYQDGSRFKRKFGPCC
ncbi:nitroreductase family protein [Lactococcus cremoris]|uniref:nitroreductase family protein n=1 Tax=Lactococcus lactis subsp. cremoris TaxID=1359 RepID=UPI002FC99013